MLNFDHKSLVSLVDPAWRGLNASDLRSVAILLVFSLLFALETLGGYRKAPNSTTRQSYFSNLGTFIMNDTLMSLMSVSALFVVAEKLGHWGLLHKVHDPMLKTVLSFLALDLTLYFWHRLNHTFDCLWMFHKVHHSDPTMNVSTAFRLHFVEVVLTAVVKSVFIVVMGVQSAVVLANEAIITLMIMFHHANIRFPAELWLSKVFIIPSLHRVHHSALRKEHDNNYGAVFSFWDRLFGSFTETEPAKIGLASVPGMGMLELVKYGLSKNWIPGPLPAFSASRMLVEKMIAEAAYYRAKERGFAPGYDFIDWLEAEKEIKSRLWQGKKSKSQHLFKLCC